MSLQKVTPLLKQYFELRAQYPDTIMLFQVGDFYELFFEDAKTVSSFLGIALTKRGKINNEDVPLCGIPVHALKHYLIKLIKGGFKVALCDQLSSPKPGSIVERGVRAVFTPGTLIDDQLLDTKSPSYLFSLYPCNNNRWGIIACEILTAQLFATSFSSGEYRLLEGELTRFFPDEIILPRQEQSLEIESYCKKQGYAVNYSKKIESGTYDHESMVEWLSGFHERAKKVLAHFEELNETLAMLYCYLHHTHQGALKLFNNMHYYNPSDYATIDGATARNLEIVKNNQDGTSKNTLLSILDRAKTPMGSRTIKKWLLRPLLSRKAIVSRLDVVSFFSAHPSLLQKLSDHFSGLADLERIVGRIALAKASISDYLLLKSSLKKVSSIKELMLASSSYELACSLKDMLFDYSSLISLLECSLEEDVSRGYIIARAFDSKLDSLRDLVENAQQKMVELEAQEIEKTGIESLKIRYNKIVGYAIEITNTHRSKIPSHYIRQQTLTNRERFVTSELLEREKEIEHAHSEIGAYENEVLQRVKKSVEESLPLLRKTAYALSSIDALYGFAQCAYDNSYCTPTFNESRDIIIKAGRHPVVEQALRGSFVANDTSLCDAERLWILTGPNMGGKSTYLRGVAHMCLLAQCGSLVPAKTASLPILDRIFTRIGAGDNLAEGKSTFLIEMEEAALICNQATEKSLVILDEVGRGTSTRHGLAIAQAIVEHLFEVVRARCLFATHYHELTELEKTHEGIVNYHMASKHNEGGILFLHSLLRGAAHDSFGIDVAQLSGLPSSIISRARSLLEVMNKNTYTPSFAAKSEVIELDEKVLRSKKRDEFLACLNCDEITPRQALDILSKLKAI